MAPPLGTAQPVYLIRFQILAIQGRRSTLQRLLTTVLRNFLLSESESRNRRAEQSRAEQRRSMSAAPTDVVPRGHQTRRSRDPGSFRPLAASPPPPQSRARSQTPQGHRSGAWRLLRGGPMPLDQRVSEQPAPHGPERCRTVYDAIELMLRDASHIDAGLKFYEQPPAEPESDFDRMARADGTAREDHHRRIYEHPSAEPVAFAAGAIRG